MYKPTRRVLAGSLVAAVIFASLGTGNVANAKQVYDSSNVGIANKVGAYIGEGKQDDPVATLTNGIVKASDAFVPKAAVNLTNGTSAYTAEEAALAEMSAATASDAAAEEVNTASLTDAKVYTQFQDRAVVTADSKVNIRTEPSTDSDVVGVLDRGGVCLVKEIGDEWSKIASGTCEGYIANMYLAYGDSAGEWCDNNGIARRATVNTATLKVREAKDEGSNCVTLIPEGEDYYVYSTSGEWTEVSVDDDVRGFVKSEYVDVVYENPRAVSVEEQAEADRIAKEKAEQEWLAYLAEQEALAQQQAAEQAAQQPAADTTTQTTDIAQTQTTDTTAQPEAQQVEQPAAQPVEQAAPATEQPTTQKVTAAPAGSTGTDLVNYALQFVGNPYVWGGTSLTNGADCSGFVLSIYAQYGISLPHSAAAQSGYGTEVSLSELQPGDLLFYSNGGGIGHVAIYAGGGMVVHASNRRDGIKTSSFNYRTPVKAVRLLGQ